MKDGLLHAPLAPTARERMNGPREVRPLKVPFVLGAFMKGGDVLDAPPVSAGVVRPGPLTGLLLRRVHPLGIPDKRLGPREDLVSRHVESHERIKTVRTLVLGFAVCEPSERPCLPPVRGVSVGVERRGDLTRDHGHHVFFDPSSQVEPGLKVLG